MNKTRKGFLTAGSIISIVGSSLMILVAMFLFLCGTIATEKYIKESYLNDSDYVYQENLDGSYSFTGVEEGEFVTITEEDIKMIANITSMIFKVLGVVTIAMSIAKLILAIRLLIMTGRDKYPKGNVIALLVLSILNCNLLEAGLFIVAMCQKDNVENNENQNQLPNPSVTLTDI